MKKKKRKSFARRVILRIMIWLLLIMGSSLFVTGKITSVFTDVVYGGSYQEKLYTNHEKIMQVFGEIQTALLNNRYDIERQLDHPDAQLAIMERIVTVNPRIRSCGISFIDNYYPSKGRWFCPYAWRNNEDDKQVMTRILGNADHDYLQADWFTSMLENDSVTIQWSDPFLDGYDTKTLLVACMMPIHDRQGKTVAVLSADLSLDWLNEELQFEDNYLDTLFQSYITDKVRQRFLIQEDGTYITHTDSTLILKDNFFNHIGDSEQSGNIIEMIKDGEESIFISTFSTLSVDSCASYLFYMPVKNTNWRLITVVPKIYINLSGYFIRGVQLLFIIIALIAVFIAFYFSIKNVVRPLHRLAVSADEMAKGHFSTPLPRIKRNDEIRQLRDSFENMQLALVKYINDLKETTASKAAIENELKIAHDIQMSMLPKPFQPDLEHSNIDIYGHLTPAKAIGGDFYDFFIRNERLFFCIGDVSGKGVPASLVMAVTRSLFHNISAQMSNPGHIVAALNNALVDGNDSNMFVTLFMGVLDLKTGKLCYCNAGHNEPLLLNDDVAFMPVNSNVPIGVTPGWNFTSQQITIQPGTTIFLYTDGLTEAMNINNELFGDERMADAARELIAGHEKAPQAIVERMTAAVHTFVGEAEQSDDLTMLAVTLTK